MVTEIFLAVVNTTSSNAAQNNFDIGDFTGIGVLVATAITFYLTYRHGTQSEQTRIARETWENISDSNHKFNEMLVKYKQVDQNLSEGRLIAGMDYDISGTKNELNKRCGILLDQLDYYAFLEQHKQIRGKFNLYYTE